MRDDFGIFSNGQAITVSAASNYPGTGFGSFAAGVMDCAGPGAISEAVTKFPLAVSIGIPFQGPVGSTLFVYLQESNDGVTWVNSDLQTGVVQTLTILQQPGFLILKGPIPISGSAANGKIGQYNRVYYLVGGGPFTAGTINAWLDTY